MNFLSRLVPPACPKQVINSAEYHLVVCSDSGTVSIYERESLLFCLSFAHLIECKYHSQHLLVHHQHQGLSVISIYRLDSFSLLAARLPFPHMVINFILDHSQDGFIITDQEQHFYFLSRHDRVIRQLALQLEYNLLRALQSGHLLFTLNELGTLHWARSHQIEEKGEFKVVSQNIIDFQIQDRLLVAIENGGFGQEIVRVYDQEQEKFYDNAPLYCDDYSYVQCTSLSLLHDTCLRRGVALLTQHQKKCYLQFIELTNQQPELHRFLVTDHQYSQISTNLQTARVVDHVAEDRYELEVSFQEGDSVRLVTLCLVHEKEGLRESGVLGQSNQMIQSDMYKESLRNDQAKREVIEALLSGRLLQLEGI